MRKKVLIIDQDEIIKDFLYKKLTKFNIDVILCKDGFEGSIKIKNENPDLIISNILLDRVDIRKLLKEKNEYKVTRNIPVFALSPEYNNDLERELKTIGVKEIFTKPIKVDLMLNRISEVIKAPINYDKTPSQLNAHISEDVLFIEVGTGLNNEKLNVLEYKIRALASSYKDIIMKCLIIFTNIEPIADLHIKIQHLIEIILDETAAVSSSIKVLSTSEIIPPALAMTMYENIETYDNFTSVINSLGKIDILAFGEEVEQIKGNIISQEHSMLFQEIALDLSFSTEHLPRKTSVNISIIDDDLYILEYIATVLEQEGWKTFSYNTAESFLDDYSKNVPDIVFLDLMMPRINGFQLLAKLREQNITVPIVIVTALSQKELVLKAGAFGVSNFLTKPLKVDTLISKTKEVLGLI